MTDTISLDDAEVVAVDGEDEVRVLNRVVNTSPIRSSIETHARDGH